MMQRRSFIKNGALAALGLTMCRDRAIFGAEDGADLPKNVVYRGSYANSKRVFETTRRGRVAFLGGSITEMNGYRPMVCEYLKERFPETDLTFIAAGISSTCSDVGAFRLETDVLKRDNPNDEPIDLFFVEYSVNDDQDGMFDLEHSICGMEGILRHIRAACPNVDIVMTFFVNENLMQKYREGSVATSIKAHRAVAERYDVSTIDLAKEIQEQIDAGEITWEDFGGVHPAPRGNRICADMIAALLNKAWDEPLVSRVVAHNVPEPLDRFSYGAGAFRGFDGVEMRDGMKIYVPDWSKIPGGFRPTFAGVPCLCGEQPGAEASFSFEGNALALYVLAGPDAGVVEYQIDGGEWNKAVVFHPYSQSLHYPRAVMLAHGLASGEHRATLRVSKEKPQGSSGTALRVMQICVNKE